MRVNTALRFVQQPAAALPLQMPGAISETLPDRWCFLQLWSTLGVISPVIEGFLGIAPRAAERRLAVIPNLPTGWNRVTLEAVRVGEAHFDVAVERSRTQYTVNVEGNAAEFRLEVGAYVPADVRVTTVTVNGEPAAWRSEDTLAGRVSVRASVPASAASADEIREWKACFYSSGAASTQASVYISKAKLARRAGVGGSLPPSNTEPSHQTPERRMVASASSTDGHSARSQRTGSALRKSRVWTRMN